MDKNWRLKIILIYARDLIFTSKTAHSQQWIIESFLSDSPIICSDEISLHAVKKDRKQSNTCYRSPDKWCRLCTMCRLHCIWPSMVFPCVEKHGKLFGQHQIIHQLFTPSSPCCYDFATNIAYRSHTEPPRTPTSRPSYKHQLLTWGNYYLYIKRVKEICAIADKLDDGECQLKFISVHQEDTLAEIIFVMSEVRCVSQELELDGKIIISRELTEKLEIMAV